MNMLWFTARQYEDESNRVPSIYIEDETKWPPISDAILKYIFFNENIHISIQILQKLPLKSPIDNISAFVQLMTLRRPGAKPSFEPMVFSLLTHICVTRPQWATLLNDIPIIQGKHPLSLKELF